MAVIYWQLFIDLYNLTIRQTWKWKSNWKTNKFVEFEKQKNSYICDTGRLLRKHTTEIKFTNWEHLNNYVDVKMHFDWLHNSARLNKVIDFHQNFHIYICTFTSPNLFKNCVSWFFIVAPWRTKTVKWSYMYCCV